MSPRSFAAFASTLLVCWSSAAAAGPPVAASPVPQPRPDRAMAEAQFDAWLAGFRERARAAGIPGPVLADALDGLSPDPRILSRDRKQAEFARAIWDYLDGAVSRARIESGRTAMARQAVTLAEIERRTGVEAETVVAIWGLESAYGAVRGDVPVIRALATLAQDGRRGAFFEAELLAALRIAADGDIAPGAMTGSWAGAMGHTQFMPGSYLAHAVDFTGDGRRDIWSDDPSDALASTAAYLAHHGWTSGQPWGVEVRLPQGFDAALTGQDHERAAADWARLGVRGVDGGPLRDHGAAAILLPAGLRGPALMVFGNFDVIKRYNAADSYAMAVGMLGDRLAGRDGLRADWPRGDRVLSHAERRDLQSRLTAAGFSTQGIDGRIGPDTIAAIRAFQVAMGLPPDGYASAELLTRLR